MHAAATPAASADTERLAWSALAWLARLPLLTEAQLRLLLGEGDPAVRAALRELHRRHLAAGVVVDSPEFVEPLRLHHLTDAGRTASAGRVAVESSSRADVVAAARAELLAHLARVETAVGIADTVAMLAEDWRRHGGTGDGTALALEDAGSACWAPQRGRPAATPPGIEAWVRLRAGGLQATILLAWDRAAAPRAHRRARVAAWYRADTDPDAPWGARLPLLLVVCPNTRTAAEWEHLLDGSAARRGRSLLQVGCATVSELVARGPLGRIWRCPGSGARLALLDLVNWDDETVVRVRQSGMGAMGQLSHRQVQSMTSDAMPQPLRAVPTIPGEKERSDQLAATVRRAALTLQLSANQQLLLRWVAQHPLLPAGYLAVLLDLPAPAVTALLDDLVRRRLVRTEMTPDLRDEEGPRHVLTRAGADFLAARDGVPLHRYLREGTIAAEAATPDGHGRAVAAGTAGTLRLLDLRRHPAHTAGVQRFALALAREAAVWQRRGADHRLLAWENPAEAEERFRVGDRHRTIRPDARFRCRMDGPIYDVLLEWDRGLVRRRDYARKFAAYAAYAAVHGGHAAHTRLVIATAAPARSRVQHELQRAARNSPRLAAMTVVITHDDVRGGRIIEHLQRSFDHQRPHPAADGSATM